MGRERERLSHVQLFEIPLTISHQDLLSMEFSRQEYWSGLPFPSPRDLPDPGTEPGSPTLQEDSLLPEPPGQTLIDKDVVDIYIQWKTTQP